MSFNGSDCARTILKCCNDALESRSDCERAKILSQLLFYAKLQNAPQKVIVKLQVAAGSVEKKRLVHIEEVKKVVFSC